MNIKRRILKTVATALLSSLMAGAMTSCTTTEKVGAEFIGLAAVALVAANALGGSDSSTVGSGTTYPGLGRPGPY